MPTLLILVSAVLVLSRGQTDRQTDTRTHRIIHSDTDAAKRFTPATVVGVSNKKDGYSQQNVRQRQKLISIIDYDVCILEYLQPF